MKTPADSLRSIRTTVPTPGSAEFTAQRQQLAQLIGRLLARRWLRQDLHPDVGASPSRREKTDRD
jgi:hypothetical protein